VHGAGLAALLDDGRFAAVFNLTPATSISVVDTAERRFAGEIETPGCSLVYAAGPRRVATLCADGSLLLVSLDERGAGPAASAVFFDPEGPLIEKPGARGSSLVLRLVRRLRARGRPRGRHTALRGAWSLFTAEERGNWRFGGAQPLALHERRPALRAGAPGRAGQAQGPGSAVAVFDTAKRERVQTVAIGNLSPRSWPRMGSKGELGERGSWTRSCRTRAPTGSR
jgi:methylamine dehydrogenase heavy chain